LAAVERKDACRRAWIDTGIGEDMSKEQVDEFHRHELMDRAYFVLEILQILEDHPAHTDATKEAMEKAGEALARLYNQCASERAAFKEV